MIQFTRRNRLILQLIELESPREDAFFREYHSDVTKIEEQLRTHAEKVTVRRMHHRRKYYLPDNGEVEVVRPMHNTEFCQYCTRIRVTSDGKFKPCLFKLDNHVEFLTSLRSGASVEDVKSLFLEAVRRRRPYFT